MAELLAEYDGQLRNNKEHAFVEGLAQVGLTYINDISPYFEIFSAFLAKQYSVTINDTFRGRLPENIDHLADGYAYIEGQQGFFDDFLNSDLPDLLSMTTPLTFPAGTQRMPIDIPTIERIENTQRKQPSFYLHMLLSPETHMSRVWRQDPTIQEQDFTAVHVYPLAFEQIAKRTLNFVDEVLAENPYAVLILQSDHGFHINQTQWHLIDLGYSFDQVQELTYSVFSAVRIPSEYGGLDAPISPLNITRELVNRFVGENYDLLP